MNQEMNIEQAMTALASSDEHVRASAIQALGELGHTPAVPALLALLNEADPGSRYMIVIALGKIADQRAVPALLEELCGNDTWVRVAATGGLIRMGPAAVPGLVDGLRHQNKNVRRASAKALGKIGEQNSDALRALSAALLDVDSGVRRFAAEALGRLGDAAYVPMLAEVLADVDADARIAAFKALSSIGTQEAQDAMRNWVRGA